MLRTFGQDSGSLTKVHLRDGLADELWRNAERVEPAKLLKGMVGTAGFEPTTSTV